MSNGSNGRKPSGKQSGNERPWWHSGSHCLAALLWCFTLAVAWGGAFENETGTIVVGSLAFSLAVLVSSMASVGSKR